MVELTIGKEEKFPGDVEAGVEEEVAPQQPDDVVWHGKPGKVEQKLYEVSD